MYHRLVAILLILAVFLPFAMPLPVEAASQWVNVEIDPSQVPGDLTDYIVYVDLSDLPSDFWDTTNCTDIRVFKSDGSTELAREIVSCTDSGSSGTGELWYKYTGTTSGTATTTAQIHYDGSSSDYASTSTYGSEAVWSDYDFVSHDGGDSDSSGNVTTTNNGSVDETSVVAVGDNARYYTADYYTTDYNPNTAIGTGDFVMSTWFRVANNNSRRTFIGFNDSGTFNNIYAIAAGDTGQSNRIRFYARDGASTFYELTGSGLEGYQDNTFHMAHYRRVSTTLYAYIDGSLADSGTNAAVGTTLGNTMQLGRLNTGDTMTGYLDEVRIRPSDLSANWIATEYNNQSSPSTFYWVSAEQTAGGGGGGGGATQFIIWFIAYKPEVGEFALV